MSAGGAAVGGGARLRRWDPRLCHALPHPSHTSCGRPPSLSGIGKETVRALAAVGAEVVLACRTLAAGEAAAAEMREGGARGRVVVKQLDLADLRSVDAFAADVAAELPSIDMLILNPGVLLVRRWRRGWGVGARGGQRGGQYVAASRNVGAASGSRAGRLP